MTTPAVPVRAVLFDYGFTLVGFRRPVAALTRAHAEIATLVGRPGRARRADADALVRGVHDRVEETVSAHQQSGELAEIDIVELQRRAFAEVGYALGPALLDEVSRLEQEAWWEGVWVPEATPRTLAALRDAGLRVGLCSNAPYRSASMRAQLDHLRLLPLLDSVTFSSEVGWRKPSPIIFERALAALGAEAATTVMVGDRVREDIAGGIGAGMRPIRLSALYDDPAPAPPHPVLAHLDDLTDLLGELDRGW